MPQALSSSPSVTVAIPTLNEAVFIRDVLHSFMENAYKNIVQIIVVDGGSTDNTCDIVREEMLKDSRIILLNNPKKFQAPALNLALKIAKGEVFLRADAHTYYDKNYVCNCIKALKRTGAINVGGAQRFNFKNRTQKLISFVANSKFGSGFAKYRNIHFSGFAETLYLGCFLTDALKSLGGYNELLIINEDYELNSRIIKHFGNQSIYISADIITTYFPRDSISKLIVQYYKYGLHKYLSSKVFQTFSLRSVLPILFTIILIFLIVLLTIFKYKFVFFLFLFLYVLIFLDIAITVCRNYSFKTFITSFHDCLLAPSILVIQNFSFFLGYLSSIYLYSFNKDR